MGEGDEKKDEKKQIKKPPIEVMETAISSMNEGKNARKEKTTN